MAVSTMIGTAKKIIQFGILVFLETQEMNSWGNLQDSKCDILHIFMRSFLVLRKGSHPLLTVQFFWNVFTPGPGNVLQTDPFSLTLFLFCNSHFLTTANTDLKKNVSFWVFFNSWKFARN